MYLFIVFCYIFCFLFSNSGCSVDEVVYPEYLNLDSYDSYLIKFTSHDNHILTNYAEFKSGVKKRVDLATYKPLTNVISFRGKNDSFVSILFNEELKKKSCNHIDEIEEYTFTKHLKLAWKKNINKELFYAGQQLVDSDNCDVWRFIEKNVTFDIFTNSKTNQKQAKLKRVVMRKTILNKSLEIIFKEFNYVFNNRIDDKNFEVDDDVKCD